MQKVLVIGAGGIGSAVAREIVASGGTYPTAPDGSTLTITECLPETCYTFTIFDAYNDGICCNYGSGSYAVTDEFGNVLVSGSSFGSSEATEFCVSGPEPTCDDGIQNGDEIGVDCGCSCSACFRYMLDFQRN